MVPLVNKYHIWMRCSVLHNNNLGSTWKFAHIVMPKLKLFYFFCRISKAKYHSPQRTGILPTDFGWATQTPQIFKDLSAGWCQRWLSLLFMTRPFLNTQTFSINPIAYKTKYRHLIKIRNNCNWIIETREMLLKTKVRETLPCSYIFEVWKWVPTYWGVHKPSQCNTELSCQKAGVQHCRHLSRWPIVMASGAFFVHAL